MAEYFVTWEIEVIADSKFEAVRKAREEQLDPDSTATVFTVETGTGAMEALDILEIEEEGKIKPKRLTTTKGVVMDKARLKEKTTNLLAQTFVHMERQYEKLIRSGAVDVDCYEDNYVLPKLILKALLEDEADQVALPGPDRRHKKEVENMKLFL